MVSVTLFTAVRLCTINTSSFSSCKPCTFYCTWFSFLNFNLNRDLPTFLNSLTLVQLIVFLCGISSHICTHVLFIHFSFSFWYLHISEIYSCHSHLPSSTCQLVLLPVFKIPIEILPIQSNPVLKRPIRWCRVFHTHCVCMSLCGIYICMTKHCLKWYWITHLWLTVYTTVQHNATTL